MSRKPLVVLTAGEPVASALERRGPFARMIRETTAAAWDGPWLESDLRDGGDLLAPSAVAGLIVTGSPASVTERAPWMLSAEAYLRRAIDERVPVFGICFGHQMLATALGGEVARNPAGREIGTVEVVNVATDPLLGLAGARLKANATHVDTVTRLPPGATLLSTTAKDRHAAVRFGETAWGVQFHPEMDADIIRHYIESRRSLLEEEGLDHDAIRAATEDAPESASILRRFAELVGGRAA